MKGFYIEVTNNLLDPKHRAAMGESVWLFMFFLDRMTSIDEEGIGKVLGGKPIKFDEIEHDLGIPERTYSRWMSILKKHGYINVRRTAYGLVVSVNKAKKHFGRVAENGVSHPPQMAGKIGQNVRSIITKTEDKAVDIAPIGAEWNWEEYLEKTRNSPQRHIAIIGEYWFFKEFKFESAAQANIDLRASLRPARDLVEYDEDRVMAVMDWLYSNAEFKWTLHSVLKYINDDLAKLKTKGRKPNK